VLKFFWLPQVSPTNLQIDSSVFEWERGSWYNKEKLGEDVHSCINSELTAATFMTLALQSPVWKNTCETFCFQRIYINVVKTLSNWSLPSKTQDLLTFFAFIKLNMPFSWIFRKIAHNFQAKVTIYIWIKLQDWKISKPNSVSGCWVLFHTVILWSINLTLNGSLFICNLRFLSGRAFRISSILILHFILKLLSYRRS
jgi:hypothetical protein